MIIQRYILTISFYRKCLNKLCNRKTHLSGLISSFVNTNQSAGEAIPQKQERDSWQAMSKSGLLSESGVQGISSSLASPISPRQIELPHQKWYLK